MANNNDSFSLSNQIQWFTASSIGILELLQTSCQRQDQGDRYIDRFISSSQKLIENLKELDQNFDYSRFVKKAFSVLKTPESCSLLREKNSKLLNLRDENNKKITIIPGIDLGIGYKTLTPEENIQFWQFMFLFSSSIFSMIKASNSEKFSKYVHVEQTNQHINDVLMKTGVLFNDRVFNPFIGLGEKDGTYQLDDMFTQGELPKQQNVSIESVLKMMGVDKMFDETKLNEQLKNLTDTQMKEATDGILKLMGAQNNPEVKEVCDLLVHDIVSQLKEGGFNLNNMSDTMFKVAENAKDRIDMDKMRKTVSSMKNFMENSHEKIRNMKDENGNPIGEQLMSKMAGPLSMINLMNGMNIPMPPPLSRSQSQTQTTQHTS